MRLLAVAVGLVAAAACAGAGPAARGAGAGAAGPQPCPDVAPPSYLPSTTTDSTTATEPLGVTPPGIINRGLILSAMEREFTSAIRDDGRGGTAVILLLVDPFGTPIETSVERSSGKPSLDAAALRVASIYRFTPALRVADGCAVGYRQSMPITFRVGD